jgi:hypothetical protein
MTALLILSNFSSSIVRCGWHMKTIYEHSETKVVQCYAEHEFKEFSRNKCPGIVEDEK